MGKAFESSPLLAGVPPADLRRDCNAVASWRFGFFFAQFICFFWLIGTIVSRL